MIQFDNAVKRYSKLILNETKEAGIVCWLAGGAIRDYFMGVPVKTDYDMFFPDADNYQKAYDYFKSKDCKIKWESENGCKIVYAGNTYDLVKKYFADPQTTIEAFDFTVSMFAVDLERIYHGETTFIDLAKRQLMFNKITYPASTMSRAFRYYKKGFVMCIGEMRKLFEAIKKEGAGLDLNQKNELNNDEKISSGENMQFFIGID